MERGELTLSELPVIRIEVKPATIINQCHFDAVKDPGSPQQAPLKILFSLPPS
jgi:hypothetical protein